MKTTDTAIGLLRAAAQCAESKAEIAVQKATVASWGRDEDAYRASEAEVDAAIASAEIAWSDWWAQVAWEAQHRRA